MNDINKLVYLLGQWIEYCRFYVDELMFVRLFIHKTANMLQHAKLHHKYFFFPLYSMYLPPFFPLRTL